MPDSLTEFEGRWQIARRIGDARSGGTGRFEGEAVFAPDAEGLRYTETGVLKLDGQAEFMARRVYLWRADSAGVAVSFEDGRPFHCFEFAPHPEASHWCDPDTYAVRYDFANWPDWSARWAVSGPRKSYVMTSLYSRGPA